jgi:uncharacterized protein with HEPN domain
VIDRDILYLTHIIECIETIREYTTGGKDQFLKSRMIRDAVIRNFEIIGEASGRLSDAIIQDSPIPWRRIKDFRNLLAHEYSAVNAAMVWSVVERELPPLEAETRVLLATISPP